MLNTNADTITAQLGVALAGEFRVSLIYCFEKPGVLREINDETSYYHEFSYKMYKENKEKNRLKEGILPKLHNAFEALEKGVDSVWITASDAVAREKLSGTRLML
jgi:acetylglutamate kinase